MNEQQIRETKEKIISELKEEVKQGVNEDFVENYETWKTKMESVNFIIKNTVPLAETYTSFDEFCKIIIKITDELFSSDKIDYEKLFLTNEEFAQLSAKSGSDEDMLEKMMFAEMNNKFMKNFMLILNQQHLKESIRNKLNDDFKLAESTLDLSFEMIKTIIENSEKK